MIEPYYEKDGITIYHGDCAEVLPTLGRFDLLLTDPPYGIGFAGQPTRAQRAAGQTPMAWDDEPVKTSLIALTLQSTAEAIMWGGNYYAPRPSRCWLCWHKPGAPPSMANVEVAWTSYDKNSQHMTHSISATNAERCGHPTQKPLAVMRWCLKLAGDVSSVLDPFMGSGTTLVAAKRAGMTATGIEREERYCEIAAKRLAQGVFAFDEVPA